MTAASPRLPAAHRCSSCCRPSPSLHRWARAHAGVCKCMSLHASGTHMPRSYSICWPCIDHPTCLRGAPLSITPKYPTRTACCTPQVLLFTDRPASTVLSKGLSWALGRRLAFAEVRPAQGDEGSELMGAYGVESMPAVVVVKVRGRQGCSAWPRGPCHATDKGAHMVSRPRQHWWARGRGCRSKVAGDDGQAAAAWCTHSCNCTRVLHLLTRSLTAARSTTAGRSMPRRCGSFWSALLPRSRCLMRPAAAQPVVLTARRARWCCNRWHLET